MFAVDDRPAFVVHGWKHAALVLQQARETGRAVWLLSPVGGSYTGGVGFWAAIQERIISLYPDVDARLAVDCDDAPGHVLAALRAGLRWLVFRGNDAARIRLVDIAGRSGAEIVATPAGALDLIALAEPQREIAAHLERA